MLSLNNWIFFLSMCDTQREIPFMCVHVIWRHLRQFKFIHVWILCVISTNAIQFCFKTTSQPEAGLTNQPVQPAECHSMLFSRWRQNANVKSSISLSENNANPHGSATFGIAHFFYTKLLQFVSHFLTFQSVLDQFTAEAPTERMREPFWSSGVKICMC